MNPTLRHRNRLTGFLTVIHHPKLTHLIGKCGEKNVWLLIALTILNAELALALTITADATTTSLQNAIDDYFSVEVATSTSKLVLAVVAFLTGVFIWKRNRFCKGLAGFLWFVALVEAVVGSTVYLRTEEQVSNLLIQLKTSPSLYLTEEIARMTTIVENFVGFQSLQLGVISVGIALTLMGHFKRWQILTGLGVGGISMGIALYLIDYPAVQAADVYLSILQNAEL